MVSSWILQFIDNVAPVFNGTLLAGYRSEE